MSASTPIVAAKPPLRRFRWPRTFIARFVARRTLRSATFVALTFALFSASKIIGYVDIYPTVHDRALAAALIVSNVGFIALFGTPHHLETVLGYASWYGITMGVLLGGIWAYLVATKTFRGEETAGRWEMLLAGQTTARRAAANALAGLGVSLVVFYVLAAAALVAIGSAHNVGFAVGPALYFALVCVAPAVMFMAVGALASQIMPTRARAAGLATGIFGLAYLLRAAGDITSAHWLLNISPLGWVEQLQPLLDARPIWLLPIAAFTLVLAAATIYLAGRRDLDAATFADRDTAKPHLLFLRGPLTSAIRFTRGARLSWLAGMTVFLAFFGALTKTASKIFTDSASAQQFLDRVTKASASAGAKAFLGMAFFMFILILMAYVASAVGSIRSEEAAGTLDNLLVRPISRQRWLWGRISIIVTTVLAAALLSAVVTWLSLGSSHIISFHDLLLAGINTIPAAIFTLGVGIFTFGVIPRLTTIVTYSLIAWSFIIELLGSGTNLSHWLLDTSVFNHVAFAPAAEPKWTAAWALVILGALLTTIGALAFNKRDLANE